MARPTRVVVYQPEGGYDVHRPLEGARGADTVLAEHRADRRAMELESYFEEINMRTSHGSPMSSRRADGIEPLMADARDARARRRDVVDLGPWFHNLHLPDGSQTAPHHPLGDFPRSKWEQLSPHLPEDLTGWTVLDIGCNAGFYSFELARRGARVTGLDSDPRFLRQARWAAGELGLERCTDFHEAQVYDLAHVELQYDLILFMGVFYHLRYPLLGLDIVAERVRRFLVFQSLTMPGAQVYAQTGDRPLEDRAAFHNRGWPKMAFIEHRFAGDATNWWVPNHAGVQALLRSTGMRVVGCPAREIYLCEPIPQDRRSRPCDRTELRAASGTRRPPGQLH